MTATLPWFSSSTQPPTDVAESLHSSPTTSLRDDGDPSATRTTRTAASCALSASASAALNVASPPTVGGYGVRMPTSARREACCARTGGASDGRKGGALKVSPMDGCYRRVRHERLLGKSADANDAVRTGWVPNHINGTPRASECCARVRVARFACASTYFAPDQRERRLTGSDKVRPPDRRRCNVDGEPTPAFV